MATSNKGTAVSSSDMQRFSAAVPRWLEHWGLLLLGCIILVLRRLTGGGRWMSEQVSSAEDRMLERRERVLQAYYERLNNLDESIRELTSFFFGINTAVLALVFQVVKNDLQRLVLAVVGYCVSITIYLITYKSFLAWKLYVRDMVEIEDELDYDISKKYDARLAKTPGKTVRITLVRMRFNFLFIALWFGVIGYLVYRLSIACHLYPLWLNVPLLILLLAGIIYIPWVYFVGTVRPGPVWAALRALWAREV